MLKKLRGTSLVIVGYLLSPLSWWNDLFFNLPIAYAFGYLVSLPFPSLFLPATILGYWLSNIAGFLLMQFGASDVLFSDRQPNLKKDLWVSLGTSTLYTLLVFVLVKFEIVQLPAFLSAP